MSFTILISLGIFIAIGLAVRETVTFARNREAISLRRLTLRLSMAVMLVFLLASIYVGIRIFHLADPEGALNHWLAFWGCIALLTGGVFCLVIADFRLLREETRETTNRYWRDIAETIADYEITKRKGS